MIKRQVYERWHPVQVDVPLSCREEIERGVEGEVSVSVSLGQQAGL